MAKKNGRDRNFNEYDENARLGDLTQSGRQEINFGLPETQIKATALLDEMLRNGSELDARTRQYLLLLRHQLEVDAQQMEEAAQALQEFEDAYTKLTQPANRIGAFLGKREGKVRGEDEENRMVARSLALDGIFQPA